MELKFAKNVKVNDYIMQNNIVNKVVSIVNRTKTAVSCKVDNKVISGMADDNSIVIKVGNMLIGQTYRPDDVLMTYNEAETSFIENNQDQTNQTNESITGKKNVTLEFAKQLAKDLNIESNIEESGLRNRTKCYLKAAKDINVT
jgi:D-alanyl-D-alanine dipeptidase